MTCMSFPGLPNRSIVDEVHIRVHFVDITDVHDLVVAAWVTWENPASGVSFGIRSPIFEFFEPVFKSSIKICSIEFCRKCDGKLVPLSILGKAELKGSKKVSNQPYKPLQRELNDPSHLMVESFRKNQRIHHPGCAEQNTHCQDQENNCLTCWDN